ncbi:hypothetical protein SCA6_011893 [Theobroma cacao]
MSGHMHYVVQSTDIFANNNLQLAGKLAPPERVSLVSGAALQMQRELHIIFRIGSGKVRKTWLQKCFERRKKNSCNGIHRRTQGVA